RPLEEDTAHRAVRRAEVHSRARLPDLLAAQRDQIADERADDQSQERQPPVRDDRAPVAPEIDLLLGVGVRRACTQGAATLTEAHSHWACKPSANAVSARQPRSCSMRRVSAAVRRTSPAAVGRSTTASVAPEICSSVEIASRIEASTPPPTLYSAP